MATILTKKKDTTGAPSAGDLTNSTGGAELAVNTADKRLYTKDSGGNVVEVGINPTSITTGTLNTSGAVVFNDAGADVDFRVEGDTDANLLFVDASTDRIGVGTNAPQRRLEIFGDRNAIIRLSNERVTESPDQILGSIEFFSNDSSGTGANVRSTITAKSFGGGNASYLTFSTADGTTDNVERLRIDSSGNVGIGTSTPTERLSIASADTYQFSFKNNSASSVGAFGYDSSDNMRVFVNGSERMRISSSGNAWVNATAAVTNNGEAIGAVSLTSAAPAISAKNSAGATASTHDIWNTATSGNNKFASFVTESSYTVRGTIDYNRTGGLVRYNTTSDATLKNILGDSDGAKSVEILNSTRIREFAWKDDETQKPQIGVIAQELYETYKGAVSVGGDYEVTIPAVTEQRLVSEAVLDEDGNELEAAGYETVEVEPERTETKYNPWAVDKTAFTFHLIAGWQAHEKLIKQQAETIAALEARIAALENA